MPRLKLYTIALTARHDDMGTPGTVMAVPGVCVARNLGHAIDQGMAAAKRLFPIREGWSDHKAPAIEVPSYLVEKICAQEVSTNASP